MKQAKRRYHKKENSGKIRPMNSPQQFMALPGAALSEADILILPVPHEKTVTYKPGTAAGPQAILDASEQLEFFEEDRAWCPLAHMKLAVAAEVRSDTDESDEAFHVRLAETTQQLNQTFSRDGLFIALGGEHSITPEMLFVRMPEGGTVLHIDAHADLRPHYHGSIYNHACPMYRIRQQGYQLLQVGIRSLNATEDKLINSDDGITTWLDRTLQQPHAWQALLAQVASLNGPVWLSIDVDGFDPALIAGVGTPQPGGLSWHQGLDLIEALTNNREIDLRGIDIVELAPEPSRVSDMMVAKLVQKCISYWGMANGYAERPAEGSQQGIDDE